MGGLMQVHRPVALALGARYCKTGLPSVPIHCPSPRPSVGSWQWRRSPAVAERRDQREAVQPDGDPPGRWGQTAWMWLSAPPPQPVQLQARP